jgi:SAM-dependent methyltransferase
MTDVTSTFSTASGDGYELQMGRFSRLLAPKFLDFVDASDRGRILDAGCGTGALSAELLRRTVKAEVVGVDVSAPYVAYAQETVSDPRAAFQKADLTNLPFGDGFFGQVMSQLVLMFIPDAQRALRELVRVTEPGGQVSATVWDIPGGLVFNRIVYDIVAMLDEGGEKVRTVAYNRPFIAPGALGRSWREVGLIDCREGEIAIRTNFECFDDFWTPYEGDDGVIPAFLRTVSLETQEQVKDAAHRAYTGGADDGPRSYAATAWVATGRKGL